MLDQFGTPSENFLPAQAGRQERFNFVDIDTTTASTNREITLPGYAFIWVAPDAYQSLSGGGFAETTTDSAKSVGIAHARFGLPGDPAVILKRGFTYLLPPNKTIYITNAAQANTMMRLYYSTGPRVLPFSADVSLSGSIGIGSDYVAHPIGASFVSYSAIPNGVTSIFAVAANPNGTVVRSLFLNQENASNVSLFFDTSAPANVYDTTKRALFFYTLAINMPGVFYPHQIFISAGYGCWVATGASGARFAMTWNHL
jgi:hypothetical protein